MKKIKVLHAVGAMNRGGIETWLMHVLRHIDRERFQMDFLVQTDEASDYDDEARDLGARIIPCTKPARVWRYWRKLRGILKEYGPYDVVHSHISFSGVILRVAHQMGVPIRIVHSHTDGPGQWSEGGVRRVLFLGFTNRWKPRFATLGFAASEEAAVAGFGKEWRKDARWRIYYCGIDLELFRNGVNRTALRRELGLPDDALVVGHVGRFAKVKNHAFLLRVAVAAIAQEPRIQFLLVGDGELRPTIERQIDELGIGKHVRLLGLRHDVPRLMCGAMDGFIFPSLHEGLGLVFVEAQAAGLACVISDIIPEEADQIPELVERLSLNSPVSDWAEAVLSAVRKSNCVTQAESLARLERSPFNIGTAVDQLEECYTSHLSATRDLYTTVKT